MEITTTGTARTSSGQDVSLTWTFHVDETNHKLLAKLLGEQLKVIWRSQNNAASFQSGDHVQCHVALDEKGRIKAKSLDPAEVRKAELQRKLETKAREMGLTVEELLEQLL